MAVGEYGRDDVGNDEEKAEQTGEPRVGEVKQAVAPDADSPADEFGGRGEVFRRGGGPNSDSVFTEGHPGPPDRSQLAEGGQKPEDDPRKVGAERKVEGLGGSTQEYVDRRAREHDREYVTEHAE